MLGKWWYMSVLLAFKEHEVQEPRQKYFVLAFSVVTAYWLPNIHSTFTHRNLIFFSSWHCAQINTLISQLSLGS